MVDVLSTRLQAIYNPWERVPQTDNHLSAYVRRQVAQKRKERELARGHADKTQSSQVQNNDATTLKTSPWLCFPPCPRQTLKNELCDCCETNLKELTNTPILKDQDVVDILEIEEAKSSNFFVRCFCYITHNLRVPNYPFVTVYDSVLKDERVQNAISDSASEMLSEYPESEHTGVAFRKFLAAETRKAKKILMDMHSALSNVILKLTSYLMYKLVPRFLTSVSVHPSQIEMLKKASASNLPLIFVPLHRSHLDYILIIFTLLNSNIRPPITAAGINLKIPVFGILLRWLGAFFIKRRIEPSSGTKDVIYRSVLHTYMVQCLKAGHNIKFYIEGGRTRTGKPCIPKVGLLSVIVDAYMDGTVDDALLVPVSVNYDKLVDGNFIRELLGQPKEKETFTSAMTAIWETVNSSYGSCRVDFNQPFSLRELVNAFQNIGKPPSPTADIPLVASLVENQGSSPKSLTSVASLSSLHGTDVVNKDHRQLVEHIANHLVYDCVSACPVMSTNILAFILLNKYRSGVKLGTLVNDFNATRVELTNAGRDVAFSGESIDVVNTAIHILGPALIKRERAEGSSEWDEMITPITMLPNVIELSYYGNALMPHYALQGILATSILAILKSELNNSISSVLLKETDLIQHSLYLCKILQFEFIFNKPCKDLQSVLNDTLEEMMTQGILPAYVGKTSQPSEYAIEYSDDEDIREAPSNLYRLSSCDDHLNRLRLYGMSLRPLMDTYIAAVMGLHRLIGRQMTETEYAKEVILELKSQLDTGYALYGESCSVDPIKNACKVLKKWGVLDAFTRDSVKLIYLSDEFNNRTAVQNLIDRITLYKWSDAL